MKQILLGAVAGLSLVVVTTAGVLQAGVVSVAADTPHGPVLYRLIEWVRERSIAHHAADIVAPKDLSDAGRIRRGAGNYDAMCAACHLSPGGEDSEIRKGLYPTPPDLSKQRPSVDSGQDDARRFWIIKHGVQGSGMPAWSKGGMDDDATWDMAAFLKVMPSLSADEYRRQVEASEGHTHGGMEGHGGDRETPSRHEHRHGAAPSSHTHESHQH
jgi:mono/diheme cytochrome c family protein